MKFKLLMASLFVFIFSVKAEYLIVKKNDKGELVALDNSDVKNSSAITALFLKYKWPMCIYSDLTEEEKDELLTPVIECGEEKFIQKKLQEIDKNYQIIFIPNTLYQLFGILYFLTDYQQFINSIELKELEKKTESLDRDFRGNLMNDEKDIFKPFKEINHIFYDVNSSNKQSMFFILNKYIFEYLINNKLLGNLKAFAVSSDFLSFIKNEIDIFFKGKKERDHYLFNPSALRDLYWNINNNQKIINRVIELEYIAHLNNEGFLIRGSDLIESPLQDIKKSNNSSFNSSLKEIPKEPIIGSSLNTNTKIKLKDQEPYSISFGIDLFSGAILDGGACALNFIMKKKDGLFLFVNKDEYIKNQDGKLFFIPGFSSLTSLFLKGEYFHPRVIVATSKDPKEPVRTKGHDSWGFDKNVSDAKGVIMIKKDPLIHAKNFSDFIAENGVPIARVHKEGEDESRKIIKNQKELSKYYSSMSKFANFHPFANFDPLVKKEKIKKIIMELFKINKNKEMENKIESKKAIESADPLAARIEAVGGAEKIRDMKMIAEKKIKDLAEKYRDKISTKPSTAIVKAKEKAQKDEAERKKTVAEAEKKETVTEVVAGVEKKEAVTEVVAGVEKKEAEKRRSFKYFISQPKNQFKLGIGAAAALALGYLYKKNIFSK